MSFSCGCDYDAVSFHSVTYPVARKTHVCAECRQSIPVGSAYAKRFWVYDGYAYTSKTCERCDDLQEAFSAVGFCWSEGEFLHAYHEWLVEERKNVPMWLTDLGYGRPRQ